MITVQDVRALALTLPRSSEHLVRDRVKFRVKQIVYVGFSHDETVMGFGFPKAEREALVRARPETFLLPSAGDLRFHWVLARTEHLEVEELHELVCDAWAMCVPTFLVRERLGR